MSRPPLSYVTAYLQFVVAIIFMAGYFGFLYVLFTGRAVIGDNLIELGKTLAIGLSGALGLLFAFLYLRSRVDGPPDPAQTATRQTTESVTTPTGTPPPATPTDPVLASTPTVIEPVVSSAPTPPEARGG